MVNGKWNDRALLLFFNPFTRPNEWAYDDKRRATSKVVNGHANAHTNDDHDDNPPAAHYSIASYHHSHGFCGVFKLEACWKGSPIIIIRIIVNPSNKNAPLQKKWTGRVFLNVNRGYPISRIINKTRVSRGGEETTDQIPKHPQNFYI